MNNIKCELRRVIQDYFGYNIFYVMNITDIDDKARRSKNIIMVTFRYEIRNTRVIFLKPYLKTLCISRYMSPTIL